MLFIHTAEKVVNERYDEFYVEDRLDVSLRNVIGRDLMPKDLKQTLKATVEYLYDNATEFRKIICDIRADYIYNFGHSGEVGSAYIVSRLKDIDEKAKD